MDHTCGSCGTGSGPWWTGKSSAFVCEPCGLRGRAKATPDEIRAKRAGKVEARPPDPPLPGVGTPGKTSATRTKSEADAGSSKTDPPAALSMAGVERAWQALQAAMRATPPPQESTMPEFRALWNEVWRATGQVPPPLPAMTEGKGAGGRDRGKFIAGAGISKAIQERETAGKDEPPARGRTRFMPWAGLAKADPEPDAERKPRFSVGG